MITAIIPMAGRGQRFKDAGYRWPKFALPLGGQPVINNILDSLTCDHLITIALTEHRQILRRAIALEHWTAIWVFNHPDGPLASILRATRLLTDQESEIIVNYCDNFLAHGTGEFVKQCRASGRRAGLVAFEGDYIGYTRTPNGNCTGGIYWFRSSYDLVAKAERLSLSDETGAPDVVYSFNDWFEYIASDLVNVGTPEDYELAQVNYNLANV